MFGAPWPNDALDLAKRVLYRPGHGPKNRADLVPMWFTVIA